LDCLAETNSAQSKDKFKNLCRGWALETKEFKKDLLEKEHVQWVESIGRETEEARFLYVGELTRQASSFGKSHADVIAEWKSADWQVMIAHCMKKNTLVSNRWSGDHL